MIEHVSVVPSGHAPVRRWSVRRPLRVLATALVAALLAAGLGLVTAPGASAAPAAGPPAAATLGDAAPQVAPAGTTSRLADGRT